MTPAEYAEAAREFGNHLLRSFVPHYELVWRLKPTGGTVVSWHICTLANLTGEGWRVMEYEVRRTNMVWDPNVWEIVGWRPVNMN